MAQGICLDVDNQMCLRVGSGLRLHAPQRAERTVHPRGARYGKQNHKGRESKNELPVCLVWLVLIPLFPKDANGKDFQGVET